MNGGGRPKFLKTEVLAGEGFIPGIGPLRPPARIVFWHLEIKVVDVLAHLAAEAASLVMLWASDDENPMPERPIGLDPQEAFTKHDETRDVQNSVGIQIVKLNPISEKEASKERMRGEREPPEEECEEKYPKACGWSRDDFRTGGESFRRIVLQDADLLGACQLLVSNFGLDLVPNSGRVGVCGLGLLRGGAAGGTGHDRASLAHERGAQQELHGNGRKERCIVGAERKKEDDDNGGVG
jgi:hypothetical protein